MAIEPPVGDFGCLPVSRRRAIRDAIDWSQLPGPAMAEVSYLLLKLSSSTPKGAVLCTPECTLVCRFCPAASDTCHAGSKADLRTPPAVFSGGTYVLAFSKAAESACWCTSTSALRVVV